MDFNAYWFPPLIYAVLLIVFFVHDTFSVKLNTEIGSSFRVMKAWFIFFCLQDAVWGLCDCGIISNPTFFFSSSTVFHLSSVVSTYFWLYFVLTYLKVRPKKRKLYLRIDEVLILLQFVLVVANSFTPLIFTIEEGRYVTGPLRIVVFFNQYIVFLVSAIICLLYVTGICHRSNQADQKNYLPVLFANLGPVLLGIMQFYFPHAAFYSLSYFMACFIIHMSIIVKDQNEAEIAMVFHAISKTCYSMHLIDLVKNKSTHYLESPILSHLIKGATSAQEMINRVVMGTASDEYRQLMLDFVDFKTLSERMQGKEMISCEFIGRNYGWTRLTFVSVEKVGDEQRQVIVFTQIIDESKRYEIDLIFKSNNDELTGLYNRFAYENEVKKYPVTCLDDSLVFVALDVNGLKMVNDNQGHAAGDELLIGAASCMKQCFGPYGKIFRTGGDEFFAIIHATSHELKAITSDFEEVMARWQGKMVESLSISYGCVERQDVPEGNLNEMITLADERMYSYKTDYYNKKGVDRHGQRDAHITLCSLYTKILKVNLTNDTFQVINIEDEEKAQSMGYSDRLSEWLHNFGKAGLVHPDDLEDYLNKTTIDYIRQHFSKGDRKSLHIFYRRKIGTSFQQVMMEIVPTNDYSHQQEQFFLYVKNID